METRYIGWSLLLRSHSYKMLRSIFLEIYKKVPKDQRKIWLTVDGGNLMCKGIGAFFPLQRVENNLCRTRMQSLHGKEVTVNKR